MTPDETDEWAPGGVMDGRFGPPARATAAGRPDDRRLRRRPAGQRMVPPWVVGVAIVALVVAMFAWPRSTERPTPVPIDTNTPSADALGRDAATGELDAIPAADDPATTTTGPRSEPPPTAPTGSTRSTGSTRPSGSTPISDDGRSAEASAPAVFETSELDPSVPRGADVVAVVVETDGTLHSIDLAAGTISSTTAVAITSGAPAYVFADDEAIVAVAYDRVPGFRLDDAGSLTTIPPDEQPGGLLYPGPFEGTAWQLDRGAHPAAAASLVDMTGRSLGPSVEADGDLVGVDGRGGLLVSAPGGTYVVGASPTSRLTGGELVAVGAEYVISFECDASLDCAYIRTDRGTGDSVDIDGTALGARVDEADRSMQNLLGGGVSPDGGVAFVRTAPLPDRSTAFVDLEAGTVVDAGRSEVPSPIVWSSDGSVALFAGDLSLRAYVRESATVVDVDGIGAVKALAARVESAGDDDPAAAEAIGSLFESGAAFENGAVFEDDLTLGSAGS